MADNVENGAFPATFNGWRWMRVYYFEECKDELILEGIWPAVRRAITGSSAMVYFFRDWIGGPNILVGLDGLAGDRGQICAEEIRHYLLKFPSKTQISEFAFASQTAKLAVLESRCPEDLTGRLQANNAVLFDCKEPYSPLLKSNALKNGVRHFLCATSEMAVNWMKLIRTGQLERTQIAMTAMIALAWIADRYRLRSHISFLSHANGFLRFLGSKQLEQAFSQRYEGRDGRKTREMITTTVSALESENFLLPQMNEYVSLMQETLENAHRRFLAGEYEPVSVWDIRPIDHSDSDSDLKRRLNQMNKEDKIMQAWRFTINLLYLFLNQLGVSVLERCLACYLITRAAEDIYGESAVSIIREVARTGEATRFITRFGKNTDETNKLGASVEGTKIS